MKLVFVHGWSVTDTSTYGELPEALLQQMPAQLDIVHIFLGRYISFHDEVTVADIARAFERARHDILGDETFSCITHSTGGPVIREWIERYYGKDRLEQIPLTHLIMLAPANHGSALAQLGKARLGRIKAWFQGIEPGQGVLNWLELGSDEQRALNLSWMEYKAAEAGLYTFVITGQDIDKKLYDYLNSYTAEKGSDGVVRVCATNMNYRYVKLAQDIKLSPIPISNDGNDDETPATAYPLKLEGPVKRMAQSHAFEILPKTSHSGKKMGIMRSIKVDDTPPSPALSTIGQCLRVKSLAGYRRTLSDMNKRTRHTQKSGRQYTMLVIRVMDDQGNAVKDFDFLLLAGRHYSPSKLPKGFFLDRQKNQINKNQLTYYLNASKMHKVRDGLLGFRIIARPGSGFAYYQPAEYRSAGIPIPRLLRGNETLLIDVVLKRFVDPHTFQLSPLMDGHVDFKHAQPSGEDISE